MGQCGAVLLVDVKEGGLVVVEPPLEGDGSLSKVLFICIATLSLYIYIFCKSGVKHIKGGSHKDIYEKLHIRIYDIYPLSTLYLRGPTYAYMDI